MALSLSSNDVSSDDFSYSCEYNALTLCYSSLSACFLLMAEFDPIDFYFFNVETI